MEEKNKILGGLVVAVIFSVFLAVGYYITNHDGNSYNNEAIFEDEIIQEEKLENTVEEVLVDNTYLYEAEENLIMVEIKGFVNNPNVYTLEQGSRLYDLIELAGGFDENAYTLNLHLAEKLYDEETIIVFSKSDAEKYEENLISIINSDNGASKINEVKDGNKSTTLININIADKTELMSLNSIGEVTSQKIIDYRELHGNFKTVEDIKNVSGIGEKTFLDFKDYICVK